MGLCSKQRASGETLRMKGHQRQPGIKNTQGLPMGQSDTGLS